MFCPTWFVIRLAPGTEIKELVLHRSMWSLTHGDGMAILGLEGWRVVFRDNRVWDEKDVDEIAFWKALPFVTFED